MVESNISHIFKRLAEYQLKVNLIQNSAISFSVCIEDNFHKFRYFLQEMQSLYKIDYTEDLSLFTIRHFNEESRKAIFKKRCFFADSDKQRNLADYNQGINK